MALLARSTGYREVQESKRILTSVLYEKKDNIAMVANYKTHLVLKPDLFPPKLPFRR